MAPAEPAVACPIGGNVSLVTAAMVTIKKEQIDKKKRERKKEGEERV